LKTSPLRFVILNTLLLTVLPSLASPAQAQAGGAGNDLAVWLDQRDLTDSELASISDQSFSSSALTQQESLEAGKLLWDARLKNIRKERAAEMEAREIVIGELKMPFWYTTFGDAPAKGRSLYISMHGGGGAPAAVNDQQYENQKRLYKPEEGIYLVPRAPTNTWNLWHEGHIDQFFDRLIANMVAFENVDPNRIYFMGYSAGGDGVYQLAPRMADRLAAAAMMAGHPNEARPEGLRNIGFTIHMGAKDSAYDRNRVAAEWGKKLDDLQAADPAGYSHETVLHEGKGHWMGLQDAVAVPWMAKFTRNPWPSKVVWVQDDILHSRFYWLQVNPEKAAAGNEVIASVKDNTIHVEKCETDTLTLLLNDQLVSLDHPVKITKPDGTEETISVTRTIGDIANSLKDRLDVSGLYTATVTVKMR
jgi:predicted esterase